MTKNLFYFHFYLNFDFNLCHHISFKIKIYKIIEFAFNFNFIAKHKKI